MPPNSPDPYTMDRRPWPRHSVQPTILQLSALRPIKKARPFGRALDLPQPRRGWSWLQGSTRVFLVALGRRRAVLGRLDGFDHELLVNSLPLELEESAPIDQLAGLVEDERRVDLLRAH